MGQSATAVAAVKIGAVDYLAKPADANDIVAALLSTKENTTTSRKSNVSR